MPRCHPRLEVRNVMICGKRTTTSLEPLFWLALERIAERRNKPLSTVVFEVNQLREDDQQLAPALREHALAYVMAVARF